MRMKIIEQNAVTAHACFLVSENKKRRFLYNDDGVYEGNFSDLDIITVDKIGRIVGNPPNPKKDEFEKFLRTLRYGHDVFGRDKTYPTKGELLFK